MHRQRAQSVCEMSAMVANWVTDPSRWLCELLLERGNFDISPEHTIFGHVTGKMRTPKKVAATNFSDVAILRMLLQRASIRPYQTVCRFGP